ncbi:MULTISPECIES: hypothetical protein [Serratia]|uniref:hypothetical protein n=1 Tax=Serratia TaxID=613 RepID=UPI000745079D|nr:MULTISPECIES: hypothetical protein [Serratia]APS34973.1 hypothetical protein RN42_14470 [Serratia marcescens]MBH2581261.1 hypothetical protein [Serratia marcescens]MBH2680842.1 hypothetical protein [Serratia marcescens]OHT34277.1 hypothetical protein BGV45_12145 [Serratia marcescens]OHT35207.1 hypothetical protein BGV46_12135 [Serratia marcescens]
MAEKLLHALPLFAAWEALIAEGNTAFNQQRDRLAMTHYQQALEVAQAILAEKPWLNADYTARFEALNLFESALAALIVTFNNMTHLRLRQKPLRGVEPHVHQARLAIEQVMEDTSLCEQMQQVAERHLLRFRIETLQVLREHRLPETSVCAPTVNHSATVH